MPFLVDLLTLHVAHEDDVWNWRQLMTENNNHRLNLLVRKFFFLLEYKQEDRRRLHHTGCFTTLGHNCRR